MLFVSLPDPDLILKLPDHVEAVELRLDLFPKIDFHQIKDFLKNLPYSVLLTTRKSRDFEALLELEPTFFDLEYGHPENLNLINRYPKTKFILSYHNFQETPSNLEEIYQNMQLEGVYAYKIAAFAHSAIDALRMLLFAKKYSRLSTICMGEMASFARVLGFKNLLNYSCLKGFETAPGQLALEDLLQIYRYNQLNSETALYALIGSPVDKSLGHIYHNRAFEKQGKNAVYVKIDVSPDELSSFFPLAIQLGFKGFSVTMPLKEKVYPFLKALDAQASQMKSVNTILVHEKELFGFNTDGAGALDALEKRGLVVNKKIVIIGAGGAARAIAFEAQARGAHVHICNRTKEKAQQLAAEIGCSSGDIPPLYDILINCAPEMSIESTLILPSALVMDIVYVPKETYFLQEAQKRGCQIVYGEEMFLNQAASQSKLWLER